ncbi:MAG TPA: universal stress protein [Baekduia sp.]|nr:universal stress protein [Baekduia sp.]
MTSPGSPTPPGRTLRTVIAGDDGGDGGRAALALAQRLAPGADLVLARAYPYDETRSRAALAVYADALRQDTEQRLAETRDATGAAGARLAALADTSPARALQRLAEREGADLVVIGSSHRGAVGRSLLGDVGRDLLHGAPCPVAVAPWRTSATQGPLRLIGVAYDGGPEARSALRLAASLARDHDARLQVTYVVESTLVPSVAGFAFDVRQLFDELREDAQQVVDRAVAALDVPVDARAVVGVAADELDHLAEQVDLMVCGSRGWGTARRVILGSTADRLIHGASRPVLVVPRPAEATGDADPASGPGLTTAGGARS